MMFQLSGILWTKDQMAEIPYKEEQEINVLQIESNRVRCRASPIFFFKGHETNPSHQTFAKIIFIFFMILFI